VDLDKALRLLRLPREVGRHPDDGQVILAGVGRYGPYVQHGGTYANLANVDEVFDVGLNRAVSVLAEKRAGGPGGRSRGEPLALKELGVHPTDGEPVRVLQGRYGPYVKHGTVNANVPKGADPAALTLEQALKLLSEREARGSKPRRGAAKGKAAKSTSTDPKAKARRPRARKKT
jgi:DNA topoisomerase I